MKRNVAREALDIPVKFRNYHRMRLTYIILFSVLIGLFTSCGSMGGARRSSKELQTHASSLSVEEQRRFDYYYLEAIRQIGRAHV